MNWRLLTLINAAIALVTVSAVIFGVTRTRTARARRRSEYATSQANPATNLPREKAEKNRVEPLVDLSKARVDDLGAIPAAELTQLMSHATAEQLAALALKFNDAPMDSRMIGGMGVFFQAWTELDPTGALSGAFRLKDITLRKLATTSVVNSVSPSSAPELIQLLTQHPDKDLLRECKETFLEPLIESWSSLDPQAAAEFMDDLGDTKNRVNYEARQKIAYSWGTLDPEAALDWVKKQKGKEFIDLPYLYDEAIQGWCLNDIAAASAYVEQHISDSAFQSAASSVADKMFAHDPEDAATWIRRLPDGDARSDAESTVARDWVEKDPATGAQWLATLPEKDQANVVHIIATSWATNNWSQASQWFATLSGDVHDEAVFAAVSYTGGSTPDQTLPLALSINNDSKRNDAIHSVIRQWAVSDPQAAEIWVKGSSLSDDQQQDLLSMIAETENEATTERVIITD